MTSRRTVALGFAFTFALAVLGAAFSAPSQKSAPVRNFEFTYLTRIPASPLGAKTLRIWIPLPQSDPYQAVGSLKIESPFSYAKHRDPEYGNEYLISASSGGTDELTRRSAHELSSNAPGTPGRPRRPPSQRAIGWSRLARSSVFPSTGPSRASSGSYRGARCARDAWDPRAAGESASNLQLRHRHHALR